MSPHGVAEDPPAPRRGTPPSEMDSPGSVVPLRVAVEQALSAPPALTAPPAETGARLHGGPPPRNLLVRAERALQACARGWAVLFGAMLLAVGLADGGHGFTAVGRRTLERVATDVAGGTRWRDRS